MALAGLDASKNIKETEIPNAYRLQIKQGLKTSYHSNSKPHSTKKTAFKINPENSYNNHTSVLSGESWYSIKIDEKTSKLLWSIKGEVMLERKLTMSLYDEKGSEIAKAKSNKYGHYSLPNLALKKGQYFVQLKDKSKEPAIRSIRIVEMGAVTKGSELEPNDKWIKANTIDLSEPLAAKTDKKAEKDYFKFLIAEDEQEVINLTLDSSNINSIKFCLLDSKGESRSCRSGKPPLVLDTLNLNSGIQGLLVSHSKAVGEYTISKSITGKIKNNNELEPNDKLIDASVFGNKGLIKGTLGKQDIDYFTLNVRQEPQLWRLQAIGSNLGVLKYLPQNGSSGASVKASSKSKRLRLDNLFLLPGTHQFSLTSRDSTKYVLRALPLGPPNLKVEREPNNNQKTAHKIELGGKRIGLLTEKSDVDNYRFHLAAKQTVQLDFNGTGKFRIQLYWDKYPIKDYSFSSSISRKLSLEPGDYYITLGAVEPSEAEYTLAIKSVFGRSKVSDIEPNNSQPLANDIPVSWILSGEVGDSYYKNDYYRLPILKQAWSINLPVDDANPGSRIDDGNGKIISKFTKLDDSTFTAQIPANTEAFFRVYGTGTYRLNLSPQSKEIEVFPPESELPLSIEMAKPKQGTVVAAYSDLSQQVTFNATITNSSPETITAELTASSTDDKWKPLQTTQSVMVAAGSSTVVPITVNIAPDAWPDTPVTVQLVAADNANRFTSSTLELQAQRFAPTVNPNRSSLVPKPLRGAINIAAAALGGKVITKEAWHGWALNDGITTVNSYFSTSKPIYKSTSPGVVQPVVELAGNSPIDVIGFSVIPFGLQGGHPSSYASKIKIELSNDGSVFETALITEVTAHTQEQFFTLEKSISARFARLTLLNSRGSSDFVLGEWKVLAKPSSLELLDETNIALPKLGGHVVWLSPGKPTHSYYKTILSPEKDYINSPYIKGLSHHWVISFNHNRAARLQSFNWHYGKDITANRYSSTDVFTSMDSPLGPWKKLATWKLDSSEKNTLTLKKPAWARFVKFIPHANPKQKYKTSINLPEQIEIFEARDDQALSVLGEWGQDSSKGPYEFMNSPDDSDKPNVLPTHITKEKAKLLDINKAINGQVRLGDYTNWYKVTIPEGKNTINISLSGLPRVNATAKLFRADNTEKEEIPFLLKKSSPQTINYEAYVEPGEYYIQVEEPPRSVVFTWDTSGSTANVRHIIQQAVLSYIKDVKPDLDEAHMLPFGGGFLSQNWLDQPYMLQSILNDYSGAGTSSDTESALIQASEKLRDRKGQKIIVLITDAQTPHNSALWNTLREVRPRIIALGVSSLGTKEQDLLQDWAWNSGNGYYESTQNIGSIERAFDRASSKIRQAAEYKIVASTELKESPKPGFLEVVSSSKKKLATTIKLPAPTIEVILDASGSMFSQMGKQRRYQVARNVLIDLVDKQLPDNANFGLRVFGHKESGSCRTDLEIPIKRLNRKAAIKKIKKIAPKSYAKTPIAAFTFSDCKRFKKD